MSTYFTGQLYCWDGSKGNISTLHLTFNSNKFNSVAIIRFANILYSCSTSFNQTVQVRNKNNFSNTYEVPNILKSTKILVHLSYLRPLWDVPIPRPPAHWAHSLLTQAGSSEKSTNFNQLFYIFNFIKNSGSALVLWVLSSLPFLQLLPQRLSCRISIWIE